MKKIYLYIFILSVSGILSVHAQKNNVSKPVEFRLPVESFVRNYVETKLADWAVWDRYEESTDSYKKRVTEQNRKIKIAEWEQEALAAYQQKYIETADWKQFSLAGPYDPDNESVLVESPLYGQFAVKVPKGAAARSFVERFGDVEISAPNFYFSGNDVLLDGLTFTLPSGQSFVYDAQLRQQYARLDIPYAFTENSGETASQNAANTETEAVSDVASHIPQTTQVNDDIYAVIIGNENYKYESATRFSANDAAVFYQYCIKTLGIPEKNIFKKEDATYGDMLTSVHFLKNASLAKNGNIRILFYYSGHGMSDLTDNSMYLIPIDGSSLTLQAALKAEYLFKELSDMKTRSATVFLDACFSGKSNEGFLAALVDGAGIEVSPREESLYGNLVVFSATSGSEIAYPYEEKQHRLFTYFLLKKLQQSGGDVDYLDLANYLITNVKSYAFDINNRLQTPKVHTSHDIAESWKSWKLTK